MEENTTFIQLTLFLSGIMRRIHGKPLDKSEDMRFKYMSPEQCAENGNVADREIATRKEPPPWTPHLPLNSSPASQPQS